MDIVEGKVITTLISIKTRTLIDQFITGLLSYTKSLSTSDQFYFSSLWHQMETYPIIHSFKKNTKHIQRF